MIKPNNGAVTSAVILLHGLGSDGANMIDLGTAMHKNLPETVFISPNAPFRFDMAPPGFDIGFQWFSLTEWSPKSMLEGANKAAPLLNKFIDEVLAEFKLPPEKLALVGFSQGTMMALHVALRRPKALAGVVGFSGALIAPELVKTEVKSKPDICLIHGHLDMVVPYGAMQMAKETLTDAGINTETHTRPFLDHSIDMDGIAVAEKFLRTKLL
jgi:phospholipase/carboxylesterase